MVGALSPSVTAALVAAAVSLITTFVTKFWLDRRAHKQDLESEYRHEQRKELKQLIGRYHGRLLEHATSWNYRMGNLYTNEPMGWLDVDAEYSTERYYFHSSVYRFLAVLSLGQQFEAEELFIDSRLVEPRDLDFVKFTKVFHWVMTDVALFHGLAYEVSSQRDHITSDRLRSLCESFAPDGRVPSFKAFEQRVREKRDLDELEPAFRLFDGLRRDEDRLRWDRFVCLHILTIAFVGTFGYVWQRPKKETIAETVGEIQHPVVTRNFVRWLPRFGLEQQELLASVQIPASVSSGEIANT